MKNTTQAAQATLPSNRSFGVVFIFFFTFISMLPVVQGNPPKIWGIVVALCIASITILRPHWLFPLNKCWTKLGLLMHNLMNPIILGLLYTLAILPIGMLYKILGKDLLSISKNPKAASYWINRNPSENKKSMQRQF